MKKRTYSYPEGFFDLDGLVIRDKAKSPVRHLTLDHISLVLDAVIYQQRTGVAVMEQAKEPRVIISFNSIAQIVGIDPLKKSEWSAGDKKKIMTEIQERFDIWASNAGPFSSAGQAELVDPAFAKRAPKLLHGIFDSLGDTQKLDGVAAILVMQSKEDESVPEARRQLRLLAASAPDKWHLTGGPAPDMIRLKTANGKPAGKAPEAKTTNGSKTFRRYATAVRAMGFTSKGMFEKAKKDLGKEEPTAAELQKWLATD